MSIQSNLNQQLFNKLALIKALINKANPSERNQMINKTLRAALSSNVCIDDMNDESIKDFQLDLINSFKFLGWC